MARATHSTEALSYMYDGGVKMLQFHTSTLVCVRLLPELQVVVDFGIVE
jgi:hypothetical protein